MPFYATFLVLTMLGAIDASYLLYKHYRKQPLVCPIGHDCNTVTSTRWATMFGVRNEVLGVAYYLLLFIAIIIVITSPDSIPNLPLYLAIATGGGFLFSLFLTYLQAFVIKNYCFYCLMSALISLFLFLNALAFLA